MKRRAPTVVQSAARPEVAALELAIERDPGAAAPWRVLGDLLEERGDPRGELIGVQHAIEGATGASWVQLKTREQALLDEHAAALLGSLKKWPKLRSTRVWWRRGFVHALSSDGFPAAAIEAFLDHPSARFVAHLAGVAPRPSGMPMMRSAGMLRSIRADAFDLATLDRFPQLDSVDAVLSVPARLQAPTLRHLAAREVTASLLAGLRHARLPALETLTLADLDAADVAPAVAAVAAHRQVTAVQLGLRGGAASADFSGLARIARRITALGLDDIAEPRSLSKLELVNVRSLSVVSGAGDGEIFAALPAMGSVERVSLFLPSDRIRYLRAFAGSAVARTTRALAVYLSKPGAALALAGGTFPALRSLDVRFDDMFSADYLRVREVLAASAWRGVTTLRLAPGWIGCLRKAPIAKSLEVLRVRLDNKARLGRGFDIRFLSSLKRLIVEVDAALEPSEIRTLGGLPCAIELVPAFDSGLEHRKCDLD
jgi:hypothetical protein